MLQLYLVLQVALVSHGNALVFSQSEARTFFMYIIKQLKQRQLSKVEVAKGSTRTLTAAREKYSIILYVSMFFFRLRNEHNTLNTKIEMYYSLCNNVVAFFSVKPNDVTLETNITVNNNCFGLWVNFTCRTFAASPPAHNYLLVKNESEVSFSATGTWIEEILRGRKFVNSCVAYQRVDNVTSTNNVSVTGNGKTGIPFRRNVTIVIVKWLSVASHSVSVALNLENKI